MRIIGAFVCLLVPISIGGWLYKTRPSPETKLFSEKASPGNVVLADLLRRASITRRAGDYAQAAKLYEQGQREAKRLNDPRFAARFLWGLANCHFQQRQYQQSLKEFLAARDSFANLGDAASLSALHGSISSVYSEVGEYESAIVSIRRALGISASDTNGLRARQLLVLATLLSQQGSNAEAQDLLQQAIVEADRFDDPSLISSVWDRLGSEYLLQKRLPEAEHALLEGYRIRKLNRLSSLGYSYKKLGLLRMEQGDLRSANVLLDASLVESGSERGRIPEWRFHHARGRMWLSKGKLKEAYADFQLALELIRNYRLGVPAGDAARVSLEGVLQEAYASYVETGARLYAEKGHPGLARETFEAIEENRAVSLSARLEERKQLYRNLTPAYWDLLGQLQSAEAAALRDSGERPRRAMRELRSSLLELHSIRIVSGAAMWADAPRQQRTGGPFVGVGDAIYNTADARRRGRIGEREARWPGWLWKANAEPLEALGLSRLPASGPEVDACAREWKGESVLLKGHDATKENIRIALASRPSVLHFATHVLQSPDRSANALIALSISGSGEDRTLSPVEIGGWNAEAGLIVLSGCSSGAAVARPGSGLMGMTRAWLMAGARAVVSSSWSTPDDAGVFFRRFYRHLQRPTGRDPADALRAAQIETLRIGGWRSQPSFWAAYFALGNY